MRAFILGQRGLPFVCVQTEAEEGERSLGAKVLKNADFGMECKQ